jgi:membrane fusion protein, multidrug efflux system
MKIKEKITTFNNKTYYSILVIIVLTLSACLQLFSNHHKSDIHLVAQEPATPQEPPTNQEPSTNEVPPDNNLNQIPVTPIEPQEPQQEPKVYADQSNSNLNEFNSLSYNVVLEPKHHTIIFSEVNTPVLKINKRMGDSFEENEVLMELDNKVFKSNYLKALSAVRKFQIELKAMKKLYEDDALSLFELEDAFASLASAEADLALAKKLLKSTKVKVPYQGKVVRILVQEYELAQQGKELIELVNSDMLYARFLVPSRLLSCLKHGTPVHIYINEINDWVTSKISRIAPVIDPSSSTIKVEAEIDNQDGHLWAGMTGSAKIEQCKKEELPLNENPEHKQDMQDRELQEMQDSSKM